MASFIVCPVIDHDPLSLHVRSRFIRFALQMGPDSVLKYAPEPPPTATGKQALGGIQVSAL
jgi:hypothetical protein